MSVSPEQEQKIYAKLWSYNYRGKSGTFSLHQLADHCVREMGDMDEETNHHFARVLTKSVEIYHYLDENVDADEDWSKRISILTRALNSIRASCAELSTFGFPKRVASRVKSGICLEIANVLDAKTSLYRRESISLLKGSE